MKLKESPEKKKESNNKPNNLEIRIKETRRRARIDYTGNENKKTP